MSNVVRGFGIETAARLAGLSRYQLVQWDNSGFFAPSLGLEDRKVRHSRIYNFKDVLALKVLAILKVKYGVSTQNLKKAKDWIGLQEDAEWADRAISVDLVRRKVLIPGDDGMPVDPEDDQSIFHFAIGPVRDQLIREIEQHSQRPESAIGQVSQARGFVNNKETYAGTRIPISAVQSFIDEGFTDSEILEQYPSLDVRDIIATRKNRLKHAG